MKRYMIVFLVVILLLTNTVSFAEIIIVESENEEYGFSAVRPDILYSNLSEEAKVYLSAMAAETAYKGQSLAEYFRALEQYHLCYQQVETRERITCVYFDDNLWLEITGDPIEKLCLAIECFDITLRLPINLVWTQGTYMNGADISDAKAKRRLETDACNGDVEQAVVVYNGMFGELQNDSKTTSCKEQLFAYALRTSSVCYGMTKSQYALLDAVLPDCGQAMLVGDYEMYASSQMKDDAYFVSMIGWNDAELAVDVYLGVSPPVSKELFPLHNQANISIYCPMLHIDMTENWIYKALHAE